MYNNVTDLSNSVAILVEDPNQNAQAPISRQSNRQT